MPAFIETHVRLDKTKKTYWIIDFESCGEHFLWLSRFHNVEIGAAKKNNKIMIYAPVLS